MWEAAASVQSRDSEVLRGGVPGVSVRVDLDDRDAEVLAEMLRWWRRQPQSQPRRHSGAPVLTDNSPDVYPFWAATGIPALSEASGTAVGTGIDDVGYASCYAFRT